MRNNKEHPLEQGTAPELTQRQMEEVLLDILKISPQCARVAQRIFRLDETYAEIADAVDRPEILEFVEKNPDISQIIRLGFYSNAINAVLELDNEADRFMSDDTTHFTSRKIQNRYKKADELNEYARKYRNFRKVQDLVKREAAEQIAGWMNRVLDTDDLSIENPYYRLVEQGRSLGEIVVVAARELQKVGMKAGHTFTSHEYTNLMELFLSLVRKEAQALNPSIHVTEPVYGEQLSKVIFDQIASFEYSNDEEVMKSVPSALREAYKLGIPLYRLLYSCVKQLPEALSHEEHPGHQVTAHLVNTLNDFEIPEPLFESLTSKNMFTVMISAGLIQLEFAGKGSFQEFVYSLEKLALQEGPTQGWYREIVDDVIQNSTRFSHKVVTHGAQVRSRIFDLDRVVPYDYDLSTRVADLLEAGDYTMMEASVDETHFPIEETSLRGELYTSVFHVHKVEAEHFLINMMITVGKKLNQPDELGLERELTRFYSQVNIKNGKIGFFIPVAYRDQIGSEIEVAILCHARQVLALIDVEALRERTQLEKDMKTAHHAGQDTQSQKSRSRQERLDDYQTDRRTNGQSHSETRTNIKPNNGFGVLDESSEAAEEEASTEQAKYVPLELIPSRELRSELKAGNKKGPKARLMKELRVFLDKYNMISESKPGKGIPYVALTGPNGERIWRFRLSYDDRCVAVEVGAGKAIVVLAGDHEDTYQDYKKISQKVGQALEQYYRENNAK